jgi:hypothetical protein
MNDLTTIPEMTDSLGKGWSQPEASEIVIDEEYAIMKQVTFDKLLNYELSEPSALYAGKMWKSSTQRSLTEMAYMLHFCYANPKQPSKIYIAHRQIILI